MSKTAAILEVKFVYFRQNLNTVFTFSKLNLHQVKYCVLFFIEFSDVILAYNFE